MKCLQRIAAIGMALVLIATSAPALPTGRLDRPLPPSSLRTTALTLHPEFARTSPTAYSHAVPALHGVFPGGAIPLYAAQAARPLWDRATSASAPFEFLFGWGTPAPKPRAIDDLYRALENGDERLYRSLQSSPKRLKELIVQLENDPSRPALRHEVQNGVHSFIVETNEARFPVFIAEGETTGTWNGDAFVRTLLEHQVKTPRVRVWDAIRPAFYGTHHLEGTHLRLPLSFNGLQVLFIEYDYDVFPGHGVRSSELALKQPQDAVGEMVVFKTLHPRVSSVMVKHTHPRDSTAWMMHQATTKLSGGVYARFVEGARPGMHYSLQITFDERDRQEFEFPGNGFFTFGSPRLATDSLARYQASEWIDQFLDRLEGAHSQLHKLLETPPRGSPEMQAHLIRVLSFLLKKSAILTPEYQALCEKKMAAWSPELYREATAPVSDARADWDHEALRDFLVWPIRQVLDGSDLIEGHGMDQLSPADRKRLSRYAAFAHRYFPGVVERLPNDHTNAPNLERWLIHEDRESWILVINPENPKSPAKGDYARFSAEEVHRIFAHQLPYRDSKRRYFVIEDAVSGQRTFLESHDRLELPVSHQGVIVGMTMRANLEREERLHAVRRFAPHVLHHVHHGFRALLRLIAPANPQTVRPYLTAA